MDNIYIFYAEELSTTDIVKGICKANNKQEVRDKVKEYCNKYTILDTMSEDYNVNVWTIQEWADNYDEDLQIGAQIL